MALRLTARVAVVLVLGMSMGGVPRALAQSPPSIEADGDSLTLSAREVLITDGDTSIDLLQTVSVVQTDIASLSETASKVPVMDGVQKAQAVEITALKAQLKKQGDEALASRPLACFPCLWCGTQRTTARPNTRTILSERLSLVWFTVVHRTTAGWPSGALRSLLII